MFISYVIVSDVYFSIAEVCPRSVLKFESANKLFLMGSIQLSSYINPAFHRVKTLKLHATTFQNLICRARVKTKPNNFFLCLHA